MASLKVGDVGRVGAEWALVLDVDEGNGRALVAFAREHVEVAFLAVELVALASVHELPARDLRKLHAFTEAQLCA